MLRIEQGLPASLFHAESGMLKQYTDVHRLTVSGIAAYDIRRPEYSQDADAKLAQVRSGVARSATLLFAMQDFEGLPTHPQWLEVRDALEVDPQQAGGWRYTRAEGDTHVSYPGHQVWTATRTLRKYDPQALARERYTLVSAAPLDVSSVAAMFEDGAAIPGAVIGTATVYAVNKAVPKLSLPAEESDDLAQKYPYLADVRDQHRRGRL